MTAYVPSATYRVQFYNEFPFDAARQLPAYLKKLGVSDLYSSPIFHAQKKSGHGYDVVDHSRVNSELGGEAGFVAMSDDLRAQGLGVVLDLVPNHMGIIDEANTWWQDVLENGPASRFASYFDIDWRSPKQELWNRVLLPVLGKQFGDALEAGELKLTYDGTHFRVHYYEKVFPVAPRSWMIILEPAVAQLRNDLPKNDDVLMELESIITAIGHLPKRTDLETEQLEEREREKEVVRRRLSTLYNDSDNVRAAIDASVGATNGTPGDAPSYDAFEKVLRDQAYRLAYWRVAADEINYRRFFDVNELAAIRVELPQVFKAVHELVFRFIKEGRVRGLRIDHPDGLFDPYQYFLDLQKGCLLAQQETNIETQDFHTSTGEKVFWVVVEKILGRHESLPSNWTVDGTTGYDFLNLANSIFVDPAGEAPMLKTYHRFTGIHTAFGLLVYECKKLILGVAMAAELHVLARRLDRVSEQRRETRDFTLWSLQKALVEVMACFPVYRTYVRSGQTEVAEDDRAHILTAIRAAKRRNRAISGSVFDFIASVLLLEKTDRLTSDQFSARRDFTMRIQQMTGPVMAKGLEDTAHYRRFPLLSLNEVGGEPEPFSVSLKEFHEKNAQRAHLWPGSMLTTSTHDTKRSEDIRARVNVLSEIPGIWQKAITRWHTQNRSKRQQVEGVHVPDVNSEYHIYQTIVGTWPLDPDEHEGFPQRVRDYVLKAARESKLHTSWIDTNEGYEQALLGFVDAVLDRKVSGKFLRDIEEFIRSIAPFGAINSLSQTLLKICSPGVPDFYQGTELWNFSLVDPDNRRPVDYEKRIRLLDELAVEASPGICSELYSDWQSGRIKMYLINKALQFRLANAELFRSSEYIPLSISGSAGDHICAFARRSNGATVIAAVPRLLTRMVGVGSFPPDADQWSNTVVVLPHDLRCSLRNVFTNEDLSPAAGGIRASALFRNFPVAMLHGQC